MAYGETIDTALQRETHEEMGINGLHTQFIGRYRWDSELESELVYLYVAQYDESITFNCGEVDDGRFWTMSEIKQNIGKEVFTPNFENEFVILCNWFDKMSEYYFLL